jgi:2-methylisocitrate lyase-like PEP mutase family enzyme
MGLQGPTYTMDQLAEAGVARVSTGGSLARAALGAFMRAATEMRDLGSFTYAADAAPSADIAAMMQAQPQTQEPLE